MYSVGAIYLTILNLPRDIRYKIENIVLVGVIPGPKEPKYTINSYLAPLINDLSKAWNDGFKIESFHNEEITVRAALGCITCDIPASRKVCGFLGINASYGCNKCLKKFTTSFGQPTIYSGFNRDFWPSRTAEKHREALQKICS